LVIFDHPDRFWRRAPSLFAVTHVTFGCAGDPGGQVLTVILAGPRLELPRRLFKAQAGVPGRGAGTGRLRSMEPQVWLAERRAVDWFGQQGLAVVDEGCRRENGWGYRHFLLRASLGSPAS
jgi:hypothetical protein